MGSRESHAQASASILPMKAPKDFFEHYRQEVVSCSSLQELFDLILHSKADEMALLNDSSEPIEMMFDHFKAVFARGESVSIALFYSIK